jgi:hypothetical protein
LPNSIKHVSTKNQNLQFHSTDLSIYENNMKAKKCMKNDKESKSSSTLSLHIAAYENAIKATTVNSQEKFLQTSLKKHKNDKLSTSCKNLKQFFTGQGTKNYMEIPRQQEQKESEPEVMHFQASHKLFVPNDLESSSAQPQLGQIRSQQQIQPSNFLASPNGC